MLVCIVRQCRRIQWLAIYDMYSYSDFQTKIIVDLKWITTKSELWVSSRVTSRSCLCRPSRRMMVWLRSGIRWIYCWPIKMWLFRICRYTWTRLDRFHRCLRLCPRSRFLFSRRKKMTICLILYSYHHRKTGYRLTQVKPLEVNERDSCSKRSMMIILNTPQRTPPPRKICSNDLQT